MCLISVCCYQTIYSFFPVLEYLSQTKMETCYFSHIKKKKNNKQHNLSWPYSPQPYPFTEKFCKRIVCPLYLQSLVSVPTHRPLPLPAHLRWRHSLTVTVALWPRGCWIQPPVLSPHLTWPVSTTSSFPEYFFSWIPGAPLALGSLLPSFLHWVPSSVSFSSALPPSLPP